MPDNFILQWFSETNIQSALIAPLISAGVSYIGFKIHNVKKQKTSLSVLIQKIEELAIEHWCSAGNDESNRYRAMNIQLKLRTLSWRVDQDKAGVGKAYREYRKAITGDDFAEPDRELIDFENPRIEIISSKARDLRKALNIKKEH